MPIVRRDVKHVQTEVRKTDYNKQYILRNVESILQNRDINKMTKQTYYFMTLQCGTIAHYDMQGWCHYYHDLRDFINLFLEPDEYGIGLRRVLDYKGYTDKPDVRDIIHGITDLCQKYRDSIFSEFTSKEQALTQEVIKRLQTGELTLKELMNS